MVADKVAADMAKSGVSGDTLGLGAKRLGIGRATVARARRVRKIAAPELVVAVEGGKVELNTAVRASRLSKDDQKAVAESDKPKVEVKKHERAAREVALGAATREAAEKLGKDQFGIIVADPPWKFEVRSEAGKDRAPGYAVMEDDAIAALDVESAAFLACTLTRRSRNQRGSKRNTAACEHPMIEAVPCWVLLKDMATRLAACCRVSTGS